MSNLLVIDWDFFFPNPMEDGRSMRDEPQLLLYDWAHKESIFNVYQIWEERAAGFAYYSLPLPVVTDEWGSLRYLFNLTDDYQVIHTESNLYAGSDKVFDGGTPSFDSVWLYDAHHDCGYSVNSYVEWENEYDETGAVSCEDWMLVHYRDNAELHWRYPTWMTRYDNKAPRIPAGVELDYAKHDPTNMPDVEFDTVFICRSGAWVPSWCDREYDAFLGTWGEQFKNISNPGRLHQVPEAVGVLQGQYPIRKFDVGHVHKSVEARKRMAKMVEQQGGKLL